MHSFEIFHEYQKSSWELADIPWDAIDPERVTPEHRKLARSAVMGECNVLAALHGFLNESIHDYDFAAYAATWSYQELQHHYAFKTWLRHVGDDVDDRPVEAMRPPYPPGITHASTLATNIISEISVCHGYSQVARHVDEPALRQILTLASQDEARHAREFVHYTSRQLQRRPEELASVLETLYVYVADPVKLIKHPVSVFKGALPEVQGHETIDDGFEYFLSLEDNHLDRLRSKVYRTFSSLTAYTLDTPASIRRALRDVWARG